MSLRTFMGLPIADLATINGLPVAGMASTMGLGPLPPGTVPTEPGTIPSPYAYWSFAAGLADLVSARPIYPDQAGEQWQTYSTGGLYDGRAVANLGQTLQRLTLPLTSRSSLALSVWMKDVAGEGNRYLAAMGGDNRCNLGGIGLSGTGDAWHHWLTYTDGEHFDRYVNGAMDMNTVNYEPFAEMGSSIEMGMYPVGATISDLCIWESPDWTREEAAAYAALVHNGGLGTVWRGGAWQEVAAV